MASREIEQFRRHGLGSPICIKPGMRSYLFLLFAGPLLIGGSVLTLAKGGPLTFLADLIGLPLSAFACLLYLVILLRSRRRGLIEFSNRGIYHALYRLDLAWSDTIAMSVEPLAEVRMFLLAPVHRSSGQFRARTRCSSCQTARRFQDSAIWSKLSKCVLASGTSPTACTTLCVIR